MNSKLSCHLQPPTTRMGSSVGRSLRISLGIILEISAVLCLVNHPNFAAAEPVRGHSAQGGAAAGVDVASPAEAGAVAGGGSPNFYRQRIRPLLEQRCTVCHSCYNSPCQLNMTSAEGIDRGLVKNFEVYDPRKLRKAEPSRLGIDRKSTQEWREFSREHKFMPVTFDTGDARTNLESSFLYQLTLQKRQNPQLTVDDLLHPKEQAEKSRSCPDTPRDLRAHLANRPNAGMPYGLPPISDAQMNDLKVWTEAGSPRPLERATDARPRPEDLAPAREAEAFLNAYTTASEESGRADRKGEGGDALELAKKQSLVSRYIYEHLFIAHVSFQPLDQAKAFHRLIRSRTACDSGALDEIATRRPWDDPGGTFYYCFQRINQTIVHKTHLTHQVDSRRVARWRELFFTTPWKVSFGPRRGWLGGLFGSDGGRRTNGWSADVAPRDDQRASNPMLVFRDIPVRARYQFLLDDAGYQVDTFIRGPVCKGNTAVNSIDEQFYVFFVKPESDLMVRDQNFARAAIPLHLLPAHNGSEQVGGVLAGRRIRMKREEYRELRETHLARAFPRGLGIEDVWDGWGPADRSFSLQPNKNAALTVFRNYDSSAVTKGLLGATSKTVFLLDYSLLERLVYELVAGYDVYADISHQAQTRLYMAFLRMEAEENFLNLFPPEVRVAMRKSWYVPAHGITERIAGVINSAVLRDNDKISRMYPLLGTKRPTAVSLPAFNPDAFYSLNGTAQEEQLRGLRREVVRQLRVRLGEAALPADRLNPDKPFSAQAAHVRIGEITGFADFERELAKLSDLRALNAPWVLFMPGVSMLVLEGGGGGEGGPAEIYTLLRNKEHFNIAWIAGEKGRRNRAADSMTFARGVVGSYPNQIFRVGMGEAREFLIAMNEIRTAEDYAVWIRGFGSPRNGAASERFWANSDRLHAVFRAKAPGEFGLFDFNRMGVDYRYHDDGNESDPLMEDLERANAETVTELFGRDD